MVTSKTPSNDAKKVFKELGTCSRTFYHLLNREFEHVSEANERGADPLAGGIMQKGYQCGMLWGSTLAVGTESYRRTEDVEKGVGLAITTTQNLVDSFAKRSETINCRDITGCNLDSFFGMTKFMIKTTFQGMENSKCFKLAEAWAPEAVDAAKEGLATKNSMHGHAISCASEVVRRMGGSDREMVQVAGFAGGMGLSGNACGALAASIWKNSKAWSEDHPGKSAYNNKNAKKILKEFNTETDKTMLCYNICHQHFHSIEEHTNFIENGGCKKLIDALAHTIG